MLELPKPLIWGDRAASMPYVKGGGDAQIDSLRELLLRVERDGADPGTVDAVDRTRPTGLVERSGRGAWKVSDAGKRWLESDDKNYLIGVFHSHIRFVGELLEQLTAGQLLHTDLMRIAKEEYDLVWGSPDQVRRRTTWLRAAGLIDLRYDNYLVITQEGIDFVAGLENRAPNSARIADLPARSVVDLPGPPSGIAEFIAGLSVKSLRERRRLIGYYPTRNSVIESLRIMATASSPRITRDEWAATCNEKFGISDTSAGQAIGSFRGMGLTEQVSRDADALTPLGAAWLESDSHFDLIRVLHGNIRFFGEILPLLDDGGSSSDLAVRAREFNIPTPDLSRRISILMEAGAIEESGIRRFRLTPPGRALMAELPMEPLGVANVPEEEPGNPEVVAVSGVVVAKESFIQLKDELRESARAAHDYTRFERAVGAAFLALGFQVEQMGGPGRTDVRISAPLPGDKKFVLIADAKASAKGQVANFDVVTLREHKEQHEADHVIAVGESFVDKRTIDRAKSENVGLLTVDLLCQVLDMANEGVLGVSEIRKIIAVPGLIAGEVVDQKVNDNRRMFQLVRQTVSALAVEAVANDEVTNGALTPSEIYMQLRNQKDSPTLQEISLVLDFLVNPIIRCVAKAQDKYFLVEHVTIVSSRLDSLGALVAGAIAESS